MPPFLDQRCNVIERCSSSGQFPVLHQLILMQLTPCKDQLQLPPRQCTTDHTGILNIDQRLESAVFGVKMRRIMVTLKHCDPYPAKQTDLRHNASHLFNVSISYFLKKVYILYYVARLPIRDKAKTPLRIAQRRFYDPYGNRTHVTAVKGPCLNRLTNGPYKYRASLKPPTFIVHYCGRPSPVS